MPIIALEVETQKEIGRSFSLNAQMRMHDALGFAGGS